MTKELIVIKALEEIDSNCTFHWQVVKQESILHIYLNREANEELDYTEIVKSVTNVLCNLDDVWQGYWLYSRIWGEIEPDWHIFVDLSSLQENPVTSIEEIQEELQDSLVIREEAEISLDSCDNLEENVNQKDIFSVSSNLDQENAQTNKHILEENKNYITGQEENNLLYDTSLSEKIINSTEEEQIESLVDLTEYCFIRNSKLLSTELVAPHLKIANLVQSFHNLSIVEQKNTAFLLKELFLSNKVIAIENYSLEIQNYWEQIKQLNEEEKRKAAIWLSRYCSDRDSTLAQIQAVFDFEVVKQKAELESVAEPTPFPNSIPLELQAPNKPHSPSQTPKKSSTHPRKKPTPSSQRVNLIIPLAWLLATIFFIFFGVHSANSGQAKEGYTPEFCQNITDPETLDYCKLAVDFVGHDLLTEIQKKSSLFSPEDQELAMVNCEAYTNARAGVKLADANPETTKTLSHSGKEILTGIYVAEATQHNLKEEKAVTNPTIRVACVFSLYKNQLQFISLDGIPYNWPEEPYVGETHLRDVQSINQALGIYSVLILLGAGTLFTAIGLFIASILNLGITIYSLEALYQSAFILGMVEAIFLTAKIPLLGMYTTLALKTIALAITSACVKGLKLHWSDGYRIVALGTITVVATKEILQHFLMLMIAAFIQ